MAATMIGCGSGQAAAQPTPTTGVTPTVPSPFVVRINMRPQEARLGTDEQVVAQIGFYTSQGRPVAGAQASAVVNYPGGPRTITSEITTFPDGRVDLAIPVAPAGSGVTRGINVRVEVVMRYQGQEYRQASGFTVR
jgi:hypothetical protein